VVGLQSVLIDYCRHYRHHYCCSPCCNC